jgi:hypothetical protein
LSVLADHDDHGHRHKHKGGSYKEEFWDGHCKVERKWKRNGEFKEKRKCQARPWSTTARRRPSWCIRQRHPVRS